MDVQDKQETQPNNNLQSEQGSKNLNNPIALTHEKIDPDNNNIFKQTKSQNATLTSISNISNHSLFQIQKANNNKQYLPDCSMSNQGSHSQSLMMSKHEPKICQDSVISVSDGSQMSLSRMNTIKNNPIRHKSFSSYKEYDQEIEYDSQGSVISKGRQQLDEKIERVLYYPQNYKKMKEIIDNYNRSGGESGLYTSYHQKHNKLKRKKGIISVIHSKLLQITSKKKSGQFVDKLLTKLIQRQYFFMNIADVLSIRQFQLINDKASDFRSKRNYDMDNKALQLFRMQTMAQNQVLQQQEKKEPIISTQNNLLNTMKQKKKRSQASYLYESTNQLLTLNTMKQPSAQKYMRQKVQNCCDKILAVLGIYKIIKPFGFIFNFWNLVFHILIVIKLIEIPVKLSFDLRVEYLDLVYFIIMCLEVLMNINTGFYREGVLISSKKKIFINYVKGKFQLDFIALLAISLDYFLNGFDYFEWLFLIKCFQIMTFMGQIDEQYQLSRKYYAQFELSKLVALLLYTGHAMGCGFYFIAKQEEKMGSSDTWIQHYEHNVDNNLEIYIHSLYYAFITMSTVGYGDISPISSYERIYGIIVTIMSCGIFGYAISTIQNIFAEKSRKQATFNLQKYKLQSYMQNRNIEESLKMEVIKHLQYQMKIEMDGQEQSEKILNKLPPVLSGKIKKNFYGNILRNQRQFLGYSSQFLEELSLHIQEKTYLPNEIVFEVQESNTANSTTSSSNTTIKQEKNKQIDQLNDEDNNQDDQEKSNNSEQLYFIHKGSIELFGKRQKSHYDNSDYQQDQQEQQEFILGNITDGDVLGLYTFITQQQRNLSARALTISRLLILERKLFLKTLKKYPIDYDLFCARKEDMMHNGQRVKCLSCRQDGHTSIECPRIILKSQIKHKLIEKSQIDQLHYEYYLANGQRSYQFKRLYRKIKHSYQSGKVNSLIRNKTDSATNNIQSSSLQNKAQSNNSNQANTIQLKFTKFNSNQANDINVKNLELENSTAENLQSNTSSNLNNNANSNQININKVKKIENEPIQEQNQQCYYNVSEGKINSWKILKDVREKLKIYREKYVKYQMQNKDTWREKEEHGTFLSEILQKFIQQRDSKPSEYYHEDFSSDYQTSSGEEQFLTDPTSQEGGFDSQYQSDHDKEFLRYTQSIKIVVKNPQTLFFLNVHRISLQDGQLYNFKDYQTYKIYESPSLQRNHTYLQSRSMQQQQQYQQGMPYDRKTSRRLSNAHKLSMQKGRTRESLKLPPDHISISDYNDQYQDDRMNQFSHFQRQRSKNLTNASNLSLPTQYNNQNKAQKLFKKYSANYTADDESQQFLGPQQRFSNLDVTSIEETIEENQPDSLNPTNHQHSQNKIKNTRLSQQKLAQLDKLQSPLYYGGGSLQNVLQPTSAQQLPQDVPQSPGNERYRHSEKYYLQQQQPGGTRVSNAETYQYFNSIKQFSTYSTRTTNVGNWRLQHNEVLEELRSRYQEKFMFDMNFDRRYQVEKRVGCKSGSSQFHQAYFPHNDYNEVIKNYIQYMEVDHVLNLKGSSDQKEYRMYHLLVQNIDEIQFLQTVYANFKNTQLQDQKIFVPAEYIDFIEWIYNYDRKLLKRIFTYKLNGRSTVQLTRKSQQPAVNISNNNNNSQKPNNGSIVISESYNQINSHTQFSNKHNESLDYNNKSNFTDVNFDVKK